MLFSGDNVDNIESEILALPQVNKVASSSRFADGEAFLEVKGELVGDLVITLQSVTSDSSLMSLLVMIDAARRYGISSIVAVISYFGYARQDRSLAPGQPVSARLVANLLETAGVTRVIALDMHNESIEGFFNVPVTNILPNQLFAQDIIQRYQDTQNIVVVAPDVGAAKRARKLAAALNKSEVVIIDKHRSAAGSSEVMNVIGDVEGRKCIITDDIVDSGGTLCNAAQALKARGALSVDAYITHGVLAGRASDKTRDVAIAKIEKSSLDHLIVTNSVNYPIGQLEYKSTQDFGELKTSRKIRVISAVEAMLSCVEDLVAL